VPFCVSFCYVLELLLVLASLASLSSGGGLVSGGVGDRASIH